MDRGEFLLLLDDLIEAEPGTLQEETQLEGLEGWDSLAVVGLIALVDEHFGLTLNPKAISACRRVGDVVALVQPQLAG